MYKQKMHRQQELMNEKGKTSQKKKRKKEKIPKKQGKNTHKLKKVIK